MAGGDLIRGLIDDIAHGAGEEFPELAQLAETCRAVTDWMANAPVPDRLAGSSPYLTMLATATCGWLMALQHIAAKAALEDGTGDTAFLEARSEEHTSELQSLMRNSYAVFCLKKKNNNKQQQHQSNK